MSIRYRLFKEFPKASKYNVLTLKVKFKCHKKKQNKTKHKLKNTILFFFFEEDKLKKYLVMSCKIKISMINKPEREGSV